MTEEPTGEPDDPLPMSPGRVLAVRVFHGSLAALLAFTVVAQARLTHDEGRSVANMFSYFTIQSNVLVMATSAILAFRPTVSGNLWRVVRLAALTGITVTGLVYELVLARYVHLSGEAAVYNVIFHYVVPIASVLGFFLIGPRLAFRRRDMAFFAWPVLYIVYTMLRGALLHPEFTGFGEAPSHYPYRFLDVDRTPTIEVVGAIAFIAVLILGIGLAYIRLERWLDDRALRT